MEEGSLSKMDTFFKKIEEKSGNELRLVPTTIIKVNMTRTEIITITLFSRICVLTYCIFKRLIALALIRFVSWTNKMCCSVKCNIPQLNVTNC